MVSPKVDGEKVGKPTTNISWYKIFENVLLLNFQLLMGNTIILILSIQNELKPNNYMNSKHTHHEIPSLQLQTKTRLENSVHCTHLAKRQNNFRGHIPSLLSPLQKSVLMDLCSKHLEQPQLGHSKIPPMLHL